MKEKLKGQCGITLVALVITIIILLILAAGSALVIMDEGIITNTQNATEDYEKAQELEKINLAISDAKIENKGGIITKENLDNALRNEFGKNNYKLTVYNETFRVTIINGTGTEYTIDANGLVGKWTQTEEGITDGEVTLQIGDYVNYDEGTGYSTTIKTTESGHSKDQTYTTENLGWRVLGVNNKGQLELISDNGTKSSVTLKGETGYLNAEDSLNNMCNELYGKGKYASSARSLKVEDVNKLANYDPTTYSGYGEIWTYRFPINGEYMQYKRTKADGILITEWTDIITNKTFRMPGRTNAIDSNNRDDIGISLENTYYSYDVIKNISNSIIANMITKGTEISNINQWLASRCVCCYSHYAGFRFRIVEEGYIKYYGLYGSYDGNNTSSYCIRPVVTLTYYTNIEKNDTNDGTTIEKACIIK